MSYAPCGVSVGTLGEEVSLGPNYDWECGTGLRLSVLLSVPGVFEAEEVRSAGPGSSGIVSVIAPFNCDFVDRLNLSTLYALKELPMLLVNLSKVSFS